jgi:transmembrane sensor
MENQRVEYLIKKYAGEGVTTKEEAELMDMIRNSKDDADLRGFMLHAWDDAHPGMILDSAKADQIFNAVVSIKKSPAFRKLYWIGWAAAVVIVCFAVSFFYQQKSAPSAEPVNTVAAVKILSGAEHRKINLPDGSSVILNENSALEYPEHFTGATREVTLKGEGYFDIRHDAKHSFIVHTGHIKTTVLGTSFNVRAIEGKTVVVTVTRGKVSVADENKVLAVLVPDEQIVFNPQYKKASVAKVRAEETVAWQKNDLFFEDTTMEEAAVTLSQKFNVKITFENNEGKNCRFTASFLKAQSLEEVIQVITAFNGATYIAKPGEIIITGKNCEN